MTLPVTDQTIPMARLDERFKIEVAGGGCDDATLRRFRQADAAEIRGVASDCTIIISLGASIAADCQVGTVNLTHCCEPGNITLVPASTSWAASLAPHADLIFVELPAARLALAAAQTGQAPGEIARQLRGRDPILLSIVREMERHAISAGAAPWHFLVDELADRLVDGRAKINRPTARGRLAPAGIERLNRYIEARLAEPLPIDALADVAGCGRSHFPRLMRRTFGISPHQYVLRLRLRRARRLIDQGCPFAEAAVAAGFSHQSHLNNWMRRLHGTTPGALAASPQSAETCKKTPPLAR